MPGRAQVIALYGDEISTVPAKEHSADIRLVLISDTHNVEINEHAFPEGDILLHAGDHSRDGTKEELAAASKWLHNIAHRYTYGCITIGGNHDVPLDTESLQAWNSQLHSHPSSPSYEALSCGDWTSDEICAANDKYFSGGKVRILQHESIFIAGITIFGSPYVPLTPSKMKRFPDGHSGRNVGFNRDFQTLNDLYSHIPTQCDVLITHTPPYGTLDTSYQYGNVPRDTPINIGSHSLSEWFSKRKKDAYASLISPNPSYLPALHVFGHEHDSRGVHRDGVLFVNAAAVDGDRGVLKSGGQYTLKDNFKPTVVDLRLPSND